MSPRIPMIDPEQPPRAVFWAVGLLALLFLGGGLYLLRQLSFTELSGAGPKELPRVLALVEDYRGPVWGLEQARGRVAARLTERGVEPGPGLTIFPDSPAHLRLLAVTCRVGFLLPPRAGDAGMPDAVVALTPGWRYLTRVAGRGNDTGARAYRAAARRLAPLGFKTLEGERFEVKASERGQDAIEHWIPVGPVGAGGQTR